MRAGEDRRGNICATRHLDVEQADEQAVAQVVGEQRRAGQRDPLAFDRRLHQVRGIVEDRPAIGFGPGGPAAANHGCQNSSSERSTYVREVLRALGQAAVREPRAAHRKEPFTVAMNEYAYSTPAATNAALPAGVASSASAAFAGADALAPVINAAS